MKRIKKPQPQSWIVRAKKKVLVEIITLPCSEESARTIPDAFAEAEEILETYSVRVVAVEPNK